MSSTPASVAFYQFIKQAVSGNCGPGYVHSYSGNRLTSSNIWMFYDDVPSLQNTTLDTGASIPNWKLGIGAITSSDSTQISYNLFYTTGFCWGGGITNAQMSQIYQAYALYNKKLGRFIT